MTWSVDPPMQVGRYTCAAIVEVDISVRSATGALSALGEKRPLVLLLLDDGGVRGVDLKGHTYEAEEIEVLYPNAIARMRDHLND